MSVRLWMQTNDTQGDIGQDCDGNAPSGDVTDT